MSEEVNIQLYEKQIAALNAHNIDECLTRIDDSWVGESETALAPGAIRGRDAYRRSLEMLFTAFPDVRFEVEQILGSGDFVVSRFRMTGTHKAIYMGIAPTNKRINLHACSVTELRNGKAIRSRVYSDNATLFQQLGVLSLPKAAAAS